MLRKHFSGFAINLLLAYLEIANFYTTKSGLFLVSENKVFCTSLHCYDLLIPISASNGSVVGSTDIFSLDPNFVENEKKYQVVKKEIVGDDLDGSEVEDGEKESGEEDDSEDEEGEEDEEEREARMQIQDETETNLVNLRRTIYLTIMSSVDFEEAGHKLLKIKLEPGQEVSLLLVNTLCFFCSTFQSFLPSPDSYLGYRCCLDFLSLVDDQRKYFSGTNIFFHCSWVLILYRVLLCRWSFV